MGHGVEFLGWLTELESDAVPKIGCCDDASMTLPRIGEEDLSRANDSITNPSFCLNGKGPRYLTNEKFKISYLSDALDERE
ncbi:unnamed protein product [Dovyalis caffra]|uniref:Uncharacterized protein n=1 Tax=Dovyalis caffra TaxID=77055 RepID=A0AAV1SHE2_9ROSI|nr:unnamed protein product [Dovyalis caffra]